MRRLLPFLVASVAACATAVQPVRLGLADDMEPIEAVIYDVDWRGVTFNVNQPAHVAVFEIVPGRGVSLLFPQYASQTNFVSGGLYTTPRGLQSGRLFYQSASPYERFPEPRYYFLIASRYPLAMGQMLSSASAVRSLLGWQRFTDRDVYSTMELLSRAIVPAYDSETQSDSWTSDVYVVWPSPSRYASIYSSYDAFRCADGRVVLGVWDYIPADCFNRRASRPGRSPVTPVTPAKPDTVAMPDTGSKRRNAEPRRPRGVPADREPRQFIPVRPGDSGSDQRIADGDDGERRGPRRTGRVAFESDPNATERRFTNSGRGAPARESAARDEGLRPVSPTSEYAREAAGRSNRETGRRASQSDRTPAAHAEPKSETRGQPRSEPKSVTHDQPRAEPRSIPRDQPRPERRSEPKPEPKSEPRSNPPRSASSASRARPPHDEAR